MVGETRISTRLLQTVYRRDVPASSSPRLLATLVGGLGSVLCVAFTWSCTTVDPGPNFVVPDEQFDADFFFCRVEPELLVAKRCGPGPGPGGGPANSCHFNSSAVSGMALTDHVPVDCVDGHPVNRAQIGAGSGPQGNLQTVSLEMSRDYLTAPLYLRPSGQNHEPIFPREDPVADVIREWATR
ncbi:MAG: hypothetical protein JWP97_2281 [Labilithrix sp.]|nr:hypothetical protein [Labilithrix sp.]